MLRPKTENYRKRTSRRTRSLITSFLLPKKRTISKNSPPTASLGPTRRPHTSTTRRNVDHLDFTALQRSTQHALPPPRSYALTSIKLPPFFNASVLIEATTSPPLSVSHYIRPSPVSSLRFSIHNSIQFPPLHCSKPYYTTFVRGDLILLPARPTKYSLRPVVPVVLILKTT